MFYFYGAKARLACLYPQPKHRLIVEPFAGAAGYTVHALTNGLASEALLYDVDPRIVEMWTRLLAMSPADVLNLTIPPHGEKSSDPMHLVVQASNAWGAAGRKAERNPDAAWTVTERAVSEWPLMLQRIARALPSVKGRVTVVHGDYREAPDIEATWFVDPPYQVTRSGRLHSGYIAGVNYDELGRWVQTRRGQVIACDQDGADWLPFAPLARGRNTNGRMQTEAIYCNENFCAPREVPRTPVYQNLLPA